MRRFFDKLDIFLMGIADDVQNVFLCVAFVTVIAIMVMLGIEFVSHKPKASAPQVTVEPMQSPQDEIMELAKANGFTPSKRVVDAILNAATAYQIDPMELTAIGIVETGLGKYAKTRQNRNGTYDRGLFQINTINESFCIEYNLDGAEGSALCAAKLLARIKAKHKDYLGRYHSKTPSKKAVYEAKLSNVFQEAKNETK